MGKICAQALSFVSVSGRPTEGFTGFAPGSLDLMLSAKPPMPSLPSGHVGRREWHDSSTPPSWLGWYANVLSCIQPKMYARQKRIYSDPILFQWICTWHQDLLATWAHSEWRLSFTLVPCSSYYALLCRALHSSLDNSRSFESSRLVTPSHTVGG